MTEKMMIDRGCFERGCMGLPNPHERLIKEDEVVWLVEGKEWVDLDIKEVDPLCEKYRDQPYKLYVEIRNLLKERNT